MSHACHGFWTCYKTLTFCSLLTRLRLPRETRSERPKVAQTCGALYILTSKCASRHNGVHFFDIATSKSGPTLVCFVHFDFKIWFAPQRRAFFRHLNFQKWSQREVFLAFSLTHVLRATTACTFSSLIWPDGSAPAALASLLFDPPEPQIIGKTECFATFLPFRASASSFFWLFLFSDLLSSSRLFSLPLPISAFHLSILSEVWLLKFLRQLYIIIYIYTSAKLTLAPPRLRHFHTWLQMQTPHLLHFLGVGGLLKHLQLQMWTSVGMQKLPGEIGHEVELVVPAAKFHIQNMLTPRDGQMEVS